MSKKTVSEKLSENTEVMDITFMTVYKVFKEYKDFAGDISVPLSDCLKSIKEIRKSIKEEIDKL